MQIPEGLQTLWSALKVACKAVKAVNMVEVTSFLGAETGGLIAVAASSVCAVVSALEVLDNYPLEIDHEEGGVEDA